MTRTLWPVNLNGTAPVYSGRMLRQVGSVKYAGARQSRPFGTRSGVSPGTPDTFVAATSTTWWVDPHTGVLDVHTSATVGPYEYALDQTESGPLTAADASNPRVDILYAQVADPSESDGTTTPGLVIGYQAGVAAVSPVAPATPARAMLLATISVPKAGGGAPSVIRQAPTLTLAGTPYQVRSDAERDALLSTIGASSVNPMWVEHVGGARAGTVERNRTGSASGWRVMGTERRVMAGSNVVTTDGAGLATITYAEPFTTSVSSIVLTTEEFGSTGIAQTVGFNPSNLTGFSARVLNRSGVPLLSTTVRVNWMAFGV